VIQSGEEMISSLSLDYILMENPAVSEGVVIGIPDEKLGEKPLAIVVLKEAYKGKVTKEDILKFFEGKVAKSWIPYDVVFTEKLPRTMTGKWDKKALKEKYKA
jgi:fatty-acyl-CoA synthase